MLVNLAVVTNVIPYIIALSALPLMMRTAGVEQGKYRVNVAVAVVAMLYSTYAIFASGKDAVMGGTLVMAIGFIIWGFIAHRFAAREAQPRQRPEGPDVKETHHATQQPEPEWPASLDGGSAIALLATAPAAFGQAAKKAAPPAAKASASTLERVKSSGSLKLGYRTDARPFSFQDASGKPGGILGGPVPGHR